MTDMGEAGFMMNSQAYYCHECNAFIILSYIIQTLCMNQKLDKNYAADHHNARTAKLTYRGRLCLFFWGDTKRMFIFILFGGKNRRGTN